MYQSRGLPMPENWNYEPGGNYRNGRASGWGQPGPRVEAPQFGNGRRPYIPPPPKRKTASYRASPSFGNRPHDNGRLTPEMIMALMGQMGGGAGLSIGGGGGGGQQFQTSWGTTQGEPQQNAGGGQSMFGVPQGMPGGAPQYQPPPGPLTQGQGGGQMSQGGQGGGMGMGGPPQGTSPYQSPPWMSPGYPQQGGGGMGGLGAPDPMMLQRLQQMGIDPSGIKFMGGGMGQQQMSEQDALRARNRAIAGRPPLQQQRPQFGNGLW